MITVGSSAAKRRTSGRLYFKPSGLTYELDLGNIVDWKRNNKTERATHMASEKGVKRVDLEQTHTVGFGYQFGLDEFPDKVMELLQKGTKGTATTQASGTAGSASFTAVKQGATYDLGKFNVTNVVIQVSAVTKTLDVDYTLDPATGRITILPTGSIADAANVSATFDHAQVILDNFTSADAVKAEGTFKFYEYDQESATIRAEHSFTGSCWINDDGTNDLSNFTKCTLEVTCHSKPAMKQRQ